jgi:type IV pilus assembly protein PilA
LAAIAIPAFLGQRQKAKSVEGDMLASDVRKDVQEFYWHTGRFPHDNAEAGLAEPEYIRGLYTNSVTVKDGVISWTKSEFGGVDSSLHPYINVKDPTAPVLWHPVNIPEGYITIGKEDDDEG